MMEPIRILLLEDQSDDAELIKRALKRIEIIFEYVEVSTEEEYKALLNADIGLILADYSLPRFNAIQALEYLKSQKHLDIPFIVVSGSISEEVAVDCMKRGAVDYLLKDRLARLGHAVFQALHDKELRYQAKLLEQSEHEQRELALTLSETVRVLNTTLDLDTVMTGILDNVGRVVPHQASSIMLIEGQSISIAYSRGFSETFTDQIKNLRFPLDTPLIKEIVIDGQFQLINDTLQEPQWTNIPETEWIRSHLSVPIRSHENIIGILNLDSPTPHAFTPTHAKWLQTLATQAAMAIENAQLYEKARDDAAQLEMLHRATFLLITSFNAKNLKAVANEIVQAVVQEFSQADCGVLLIEPETKTISRLARSGQYIVQTARPLSIDGAGLIPEAIRTGQIIYAPDVSLDPRYLPNEPLTRSELVVPLSTASGVIGALDFQSPELDAFPEHDQILLEAFAQRVAAIVENIQFYDQIRQHAEQLEQRVVERTRELLYAKQHAEAILNSTNDTIIVLQGDNHIVQANPAFARMFGYPEDEVAKLMIADLCTSASLEMWTGSLELLRKTKSPLRFDITARHFDQTEFYAEVALSLFSGEDVDRVVCALRDISLRKQTEEKLQTALAQERELRELKSRFVAIVSHEFRNPLAVIQLASAKFERHFEKMDDKQRIRNFTVIKSQLDHMKTLLDEVLSIESFESGGRKLNPTETNLIHLCKTVIDEFKQHSQKITFQYEGSQLQTALLDELLIRQLLTNLVSNAIKYSPPESNIYIDLGCNDNMMSMSVRDEGIGIPEEDQARLFQAFNRAANTTGIQGTGLGLLIAKNAAELHEGSIQFESKIGVGTTFTVNIPLKPISER